MVSSILSTLILLPLFGAITLLFVPGRYTTAIKGAALTISLLTFIMSLVVWGGFDDSTAKFQFVEVYSWIQNSNINFVLGIDGISIFFVLLTTLLTPNQEECERVFHCFLTTGVHCDCSICHP
jgi:NADH-quinone oxidoreductase subunit M